MDKTYGEITYDIDYSELPTDKVGEIKLDIAKLADKWSEMIEEVANQMDEPSEKLVIKMDYMIRALETLEAASFLVVKAQYK